MNLIAKRLYSRSVGDNVEITLSDGTKYTGKITEKDEECVAISDSQSEIIVTYEDVRSVKVLTSSGNSGVMPIDSTVSSLNTTKNFIQSEPQRSDNFTPAKAAEINTSVDIHKLKFITTVSNMKMPDLFINQTFKELPKDEKKILNSNFSSFMSAIKNSDINKCRNVVNNMKNIIEEEGDFDFSPSAYKLLAYMSSRCSIYDSDLYIKGCCYDYAAISLYVKGDYKLAAAYASMSLSTNNNPDLADQIYTIIAETLFKLNDAGGVISAIHKNALVVNDEQMSELLKYIYRINGINFSASINTVEIIATLKRMMPSDEISKAILAINKDTDDTGISSDDESASDSVLTGEITRLSWSSETGTIETEDETYKFSYSDVTDKKLLAKLKTLYISDLKAKDSTFPVKFEIKNDRICNIVSFVINTAVKPSEKNTSNTIDYSARISNIQRGRQINTDSANENRFYDSLKFFEKAIEEGEDLGEAVSEAINCCMAISNKEGTTDYLEKAYKIYQDNKEHLEKRGLKNNSILFDLFTKLGNSEESKACLDRILEDPLLPHTTRMHYIDRRADLLFNQAVQSDDTMLYEEAKSEYRSWEQQYYMNTRIRMNPSFIKLYHTVVLYRIAVCLYKTGDNGTAERVLASILNFDPDNENAKKLLMENNPSESIEEKEEIEAVDEESIPADEEADEEFLQPCDYVDPSGWAALDLSEEDVIDYALNIKGTNRIPLSLTYFKAASLLNSNFLPLYTEMSLATDNPMETLNYSLTDLVTRFQTGSSYAKTLSKFCFAAAYMRGSFYYTSDKEYFSGLEYLYDSSLDVLPSLKKALEIIDRFRLGTGKGIDYYADYRAANLEAYENRHRAVLDEASNLYERYFSRLFHESKSQLRFKLTKAILFKKGGLPERMLSCVINDNYQEFQSLKDEFCNAFIRTGMAVSTGNIQSEKVERVIDEAWKLAGEDRSVCERKTSDLMGSFRNNLRSPLNNCVRVVCDWVELCESGGQNRKDENFNKYQKTRNELIPLLNSIVQECSEQSLDADNQTEFGCCILSSLASELISRLDGSWNFSRRKYFFYDFLRTDNVILDEKFIPDVSSTFSDLPDFNILQRIRNHIESAGDTLVSHAEKIYLREEENHDYGTARLISEYLSYQDRADEWQLPDNAEEFEEQAKKQLRVRLDTFNSDVCMAISRGQIVVSDEFMNNIEETAQYWYQYCVATKNYGFFSRFVNNCTEKIHKDAVAYGETLLIQLSKLADEEELEQDIVDTITGFIDKQFFPVAEDWMSRISKGDFDSGEKAPLGVEECLNEFWDEFEENYSLVHSTGYNLRRVIRKNNLSAKDRKGGEALINNWLDNGNKSNPEKIGILLNLLGWDNIDVTDKSTDNKHEMYLVKDKSSIYGKKLYSHPIPAFSSQSYDTGFYVVCLYGYMDSKRLIDKYIELDGIYGNKIILLDHAFSSSERRNIARLVKQTPLQSTYLFIDRVSIMYIANHYISGGNNRTLMSISMPFSYLQPYVSESSHTIPPEMFIGRRNELLSIESATGANLVFGGRQLGKSALLKKAREETDDREAGRIAVFIDIVGLDIEKSALKVSKELISNGIIREGEETDDWEKLTEEIKLSINKNSISYLLIMFDEADTFIDDCKNVNYQPLVFLKDVQQSMNGKFKFVMAGLHNVVKFNRDVALGKNSVITHFSSINVKPFNYEEGRELLTKPLGYLGFTFDDELLINHILSTTNYFPGLIQLYCSKLIESMRKNYAGYNESTTPPYHVTENHIGKVLADKSFVSEIKNKFEITLTLDDEYYIIALLLAHLFVTEEKSNGYSSDEVMKLSSTLGVDNLQDFSKEQIETLLEELCDLNILKKLGECYLFRTKSFRDLLGSKLEIEEKLLELMNKNEND